MAERLRVWLTLKLCFIYSEQNNDKEPMSTKYSALFVNTNQKENTQPLPGTWSMGITDGDHD